MRLILVAGALAAAAALSGCGANSATSLNSFVTTMSQTNCHVVISTAASVGAMNPGSGVQFQAQADCPNKGVAATASAPAVAITPPASAP